MAAVAVAVAVAVAATEGGGSTIDLLNGGGADHLCAATVLTGVVLESVVMDRLTEEDDDGGAEGGSSGTSLEQHGGVSADQVTTGDPKADSDSAQGLPSPGSQQQSSLTPMAPHVFELMLQQAAEQGPWPEAPSGNGRRRNRNRTKRKKALAAAAARRAARDSALCLLASRCMQGGDVAKDPARSLAEKEIGVASSPTSSSMAAEPPSPGKGKRLEAQAAGERHEGRYWQPLWDQARACIARMGVGKVPADGGSGEGAGDGTSGQGPGQVSTAQGKGLAESSAMEVKDNASKTSPAIIEAISLEPPSPGKNERVEGTATLSTCGPRYPPPVIQQPRPCVAIMKAGEAAAEGGEVAKDPALCQVHKKVDDSASTISSAVAAGSPFPGKDERSEIQVVGEQRENRSWPSRLDQMRAWIAGMGAGKEPVEEGAGDGTSGRGLGQPSPAQGEGIVESSAVGVTEKVGETSTPTISSESISLQLPEPATSTRAEIIAAAVASCTGHAEGVVGARAESGEGSTTCPSNILELVSPAGSSIVEATTTSEIELDQEAGRVEVTADRTTATLSTSCDVEFPPQPVESIVTCYAVGLIEELEARIARRADGEVVVEGVGVVVGAGAVEGESRRRREQTEQEAKVLVPTTCERRPGDLRALFLRNLAKIKEGGAIDGACKVAVAQNALEDLCQLKVVGPLGEGASGTVSAVCSAIVPGKFALKEVREGRGQRAIDNAMAEISVLARLSGVPHPNVISALAVNDSQISKPILLPIAECDFGSVLTEGIWTKRELFRQIGCGAEHIHNHGLVHGDIKPENVLMFRGEGGDLVPRLADFGTARDLGDIRPQMTGTVGYMPLECMQGPVAVSASQDVFSLAAMTWDFCAVSNKKRPNMFAHPDLYTERERKYMVFLGYTTAPSQVADRLLRYEWKVTARVLEDGSYTKLLNKESLSEDLGTKGREAVSDYLPWLLSKDPAERPSIASFQSVMDLFAEEAKNETAVEA
eukprot:jgi/Undpi1/10628/HiC_scaffold_29.g13078.m1